MKRTILLALIILLAAGTATAQTVDKGIPFGARVGLSFDPDQFHVGAHAKMLELTPDLTFVPNIEFGTGNNVNIFAFNAELVYSFYAADLGGFTPYAGGGLGINYIDPDHDNADSETKLVLNFLGGISKMLDDTKEMFIELKVGPSDWAPDIKLTVGLTFF